MPGRPELSIEVAASVPSDAPDATVVAGATIAGTVRLAAAEPQKCRRVIVQVGWRTSGKGDRDESWTDHELRGEGTMQPGETLAFELPVPLGPVTYRGRIVKIDWAVRARVDRPWAFDARAEAPFTVIA